MDRVKIYAGAIPLETDLLSASKYGMIGLSKLASAIMGTSTLLNGLSCTQNSPAALNVLVAPGEIYALKNVDDTAYSSIAADTTHQILKQGLSMDTTTLSCPAPSTIGHSINYLVQVRYADVDGGDTVLPYYNASNPASAWSGPNNDGTTNTTVRQGQCQIAVKTGTSAPTGTQVTPSADAGYTAAYVVTVAYGATTIVNANISLASGAPFINTTLTNLAPLDSPAFINNPTAPEQNRNDRSTKIANTAFVQHAISGILTKSVAGASDVTLTSQEAGNGILLLTGVLTGNINVIVPTQEDQWVVRNGTTGSFSLTVKTAAGTGVLVSQSSPTNSVVLYCDGTNVLSAGSGGAGFFTAYPTTATAGQTSFSATYTPGALAVTRNGVWLAAADYTATSGTAVVLNTAAALNDVVVVYAFQTFSVANALSQATADTLYSSITVGGPQGAFSNLQASASGSSATISVTADEVVLKNTSNAYATARSVSLSVSGASSGANGLDTGSLATSTWYSLWVIYNGTTVSGLLSTSATAPTMPTGYTYKARVGWIRTDASGNKYPLGFTQHGKKVKLKVSAGGNVAALPAIASGVIGTYSHTAPTWATQSISNYAPSTASLIALVVSNCYNSGAVSNISVAPNSDYAGTTSANPPPMTLINPTTGTNNMVQPLDLQLEGTNIYIASSATGGAVLSAGWEDNL